MFETKNNHRLHQECHKAARPMHRTLEKEQNSRSKPSFHPPDPASHFAKQSASTFITGYRLPDLAAKVLATYSPTYPTYPATLNQTAPPSLRSQSGATYRPSTSAPCPGANALPYETRKREAVHKPGLALGSARKSRQRSAPRPRERILPQTLQAPAVLIKASIHSCFSQLIRHSKSRPYQRTEPLYVGDEEVGRRVRQKFTVQ
eukprot:2586721-Pleurochrysis_carterae.AAC.1